MLSPGAEAPARGDSSSLSGRMTPPREGERCGNKRIHILEDLLPL